MCSYNKPCMSKKSSAKTGGPLSTGLPEPLNTRPAMQTHISEYIYKVHVVAQNAVSKHAHLP